MPRRFRAEAWRKLRPPGSRRARCTTQRPYARAFRICARSWEVLPTSRAREAVRVETGEAFGDKHRAKAQFVAELARQGLRAGIGGIRRQHLRVRERPDRDRRVHAAPLELIQG